ncbi:MAG: hypothetical protein ABIO62_13240 [Paracoccaceae bacterium]
MADDRVLARWLQEQTQKRLRAVGYLIELVNGPLEGERPTEITDPISFVHQAFDLYRAGLPDNDMCISDLARVEHDFIAALCALSYDAQRKQLRAALKTMKVFSPSLYPVKN